MGKCRQHRHLGDVPQPDHGVADMRQPARLGFPALGHLGPCLIGRADEHSISGSLTLRITSQPLSVFQFVLPRCFHDLCETRRTIGMSENAIGRIHAIGFEIRPSGDPALMIERNHGLISNESAETTDREHRSLSLGREWRLVSYMSEHGFKSHAPPLSFKVEFTPVQEQQGDEVLFQ
jgi:hypothetical protein